MFAVSAIVAAAGCGTVVSPDRGTPDAATSFNASRGADADGKERFGRVDLRVARAELLAADRAYAAATARGLLTGLPSRWANDVVLLWPTFPVVRGRPAARALLEGLPDAASRKMTWYPVRADASADGRDGYTYGYGSRTRAGVAGVDTSYIQYVAYWQKNAAGTWRVRAWVFGGSAPNQPPAAPPGCETPADPFSPTFPNAGRDAVAEALLALDRAFAAQAAAEGAYPAFLTYVARDGAAVGAGELIVCGRRETAALYQNLTPGALTWTPAIGVSAASGDLGFTVGLGAFNTPPEPSFTKYLTVWQRTRARGWRFVVDAGNSAPAATPPVTAVPAQ